MQKPYSGRNRRRVFRLYLPQESRLIARIDEQDFEVIEVAEFSLLLDAEEVPNVRGRCAGHIHWSDGSQAKFKGEVGRQKQSRLVIWNISGIEMTHVIGEQRRLLTKQSYRNDSRRVG